MKATNAEINVANRLLKFNKVDSQLYLDNGQVKATGILALSLGLVTTFKELTEMHPTYFKPF